MFCQQQANSDSIDSRQLGQEETPPHPIYPQSGYRILPGDDIIPIRDGGTLLFLEVPIRDIWSALLRCKKNQ